MPSFFKGLSYLLAAFAISGSARAEEAADCAHGAFPPVMAARVLDGRTFVTTDGRSVRLAGVLPPDAFEAGAAEGDWRHEAEAVRVLSDLIVGKQVVVTAAQGRDGLDRHGRTVAQVHVIESAGPRWVQGTMIDAGMAVALPEPASMACHGAALAREAVARSAQTGLFATVLWRVADLASEDLPVGIDGSFRIVTGVARRTWRQRAGMVVLVDGGRRRGSEIEVVLEGEEARASAPGKAGAQALLGKRVEVRGWFELKEPRNDGRRGAARFVVRTGPAGGMRVIGATDAIAPEAREADLLPLIETGGEVAE